MSGVSFPGGMPRVEAYRLYWRNLWAGRAGLTQAEASGRASYGEQEIQIVVDDAVRVLELKPTDSLLDIGCAKGLMGDRLRPLVRHYVGLDYIQGVKPSVVGDAVALPFRDAAFEKVLLAGVLVCIPPEHHAATLSELRRVTRPGGRGFVTCNPFRYIHDMAHVFKEPELAALAQDCGWKRATCVGINAKLEQSFYYFDMVLE